MGVATRTQFWGWYIVTLSHCNALQSASRNRFPLASESRLTPAVPAVQLNVSAPLRLTRRLAPSLVERGVSQGSKDTLYICGAIVAHAALLSWPFPQRCSYAFGSHAAERQQLIARPNCVSQFRVTHDSSLHVPPAPRTVVSTAQPGHCCRKPGNHSSRFPGPQAGAIINTGSMAAVAANPEQCSYVATKHAVLGFFMSAFEVLRHHGIKVCIINPGEFLPLK